MPDRPEPVRVSLPTSAKVAGAVFALLMLGLLTTQVILIEDQRSTTDRQLRTAVRQANAALPLIEDAQPLVEEIRGGAPAIRKLGRDASGLVRETRPLVQELDRARIGEQLEAAGALSRVLLRADVGSTTEAVRRLATVVERADLPRGVTALTDIAGELQRKRRLRRLLVRSNAVLGEVRARRTVRKVTRLAELAPEQLRILEDSRRIQAESLAVQRQILEIARETERHAESIDRKTGGSAPPPVPAGLPGAAGG